jgi:hypothetical protein
MARITHRNDRMHRGLVPTAQLGTGSATSTTVLLGNQTWGAAPGTSFGSNSNSVGSANAPGASSSNARADHVHQGVHQLTANGSNALVGDVNVAAGSGIGVTQSGQTVTITNTGSSGGAGGSTLTIEEADGSPTGSATKLVLPNGTLSYVGTVATYTPTAGGSTDAILGQSGVGGARISGLQGSPDIDVAGTNDDEFNTTTASGSTPTGWSITANTPTTLDVNTTRKSALYVKYTNAVGADRVAGLIKAAPSIPFTVTAKIRDATLKASNYAGAFIGLSDNSVGNGKGTVWMTLWNQGTSVSRQLNLSTYTTLIPGGGGSASGGANPFALSGVAFPPCYLRIIVTAANNVAYEFSQGGDIWYTAVSGNSFLASATYVLIGCFSIGATAEGSFDWIRFT